MQKERNKQRGSVLAFTAVGMLGIIGVASLAIDLGHSYLNKGRLQNALDAAALSGAVSLMNSRNTAVARGDATETFDEHLVGEMAAGGMNLTVQFSLTLNPFVPGGGNDSDYVRAIVNDFNRPYFLASALPGIGATKIIAASAVAGKQPLSGGSQVCDIAPLLVCGDPLDDNTGDTFFGIKYDDGTGTNGKYCLKASASSGGNGNNNNNGGGGNLNWPDDCDNEAIHSTNVEQGIGPGNFQLIQLDCGPGGNCVRENLAGGYGSCLTDASAVTTKPGNTVGPTAQGFNTRFGVYQGGMSRAEYPPDLVTSDIPYNEYTSIYANDGPWDEQDGAPYRRVMAVPIGDCQADIVGSGQTDVPLLGLGCFYMSEPTENTGQANWIKGHLVRECQTGGRPSTNPDTNSVGNGPFRIILYKNPDSAES